MAVDCNLTDYELPTTEWKTISIILYVMCEIVIVFSNLIILINMKHTCYLCYNHMTKFFYSALAVADILVGLVCCNLEIVYIAIPDYAICTKACYYFSAVYSAVMVLSLLFLCCVSIDRYIAITRPLRYPMIVTPTRSRWVVSTCIFFACIAFFMDIISYFQKKECSIRSMHSDKKGDIFVGYILIICCGPLFLLLFTNIRFLLIIRRSSRKPIQSKNGKIGNRTSRVTSIEISEVIYSESGRKRSRELLVQRERCHSTPKEDESCERVSDLSTCDRHGEIISAGAHTDNSFYSEPGVKRSPALLVQRERCHSAPKEYESCERVSDLSTCDRHGEIISAGAHTDNSFYSEPGVKRSPALLVQRERCHSAPKEYESCERVSDLSTCDRHGEMISAGAHTGTGFYSEPGVKRSPKLLVQRERCHSTPKEDESCERVSDLSTCDRHGEMISAGAHTDNSFYSEPGVKRSPALLVQRERCHSAPKEYESCERVSDLSTCDRHGEMISAGAHTGTGFYSEPGVKRSPKLLVQRERCHSTPKEDESCERVSDLSTSDQNSGTVSAGANTDSGFDSENRNCDPIDTSYMQTAATIEETSNERETSLSSNHLKLDMVKEQEIICHKISEISRTCTLRTSGGIIRRSSDVVTNRANHVKGVRTVLIVALTCLVCWLPFVGVAGTKASVEVHIPYSVIFIVSFLILCNSFCNAFIFLLLSPCYRKLFFLFFARPFRKKEKFSQKRRAT